MKVKRRQARGRAREGRKRRKVLIIKLSDKQGTDREGTEEGRSEGEREDK